MLTSPSDQFVGRLHNYGEHTDHIIGETKIRNTPIPTLRSGEDRIIIFCRSENDNEDVSYKEWIQDNPPDIFENTKVFEIVISVSNEDDIPTGGEVLQRGVKISPFHTSISRAIGLPDGWRETQKAYVNQTLEPLRLDGDINLAKLYLRLGNNRVDALSWLTDSLSGWEANAGEVTYLRAEAGKGKSTLLAKSTRDLLDSGEGPLPLYVPLRNLKREAGISWEGVASCIGVMGEAAENLKAATKSGLVSLALDGLDEVAGRYDETTIDNVINIVLDKLQTSVSSIIISGRTTEATLLDKDKTIEAGIELPDANEEAFRNYTDIVVNKITPEWPIISENIQPPSILRNNITEEDPTEEQKEDIVDWIQIVFDELGKERSLFFVQSLACLARSYQSDNQPFLIRGRDEPAKRRPPLQDVCLLAARLACYREQKKIEDIASGEFETGKQVKLLSALALLATSESSLRTDLPTAKEIAESVFEIDPVNRNEVFTAVIRQMQKHALLFSDTSNGAKAGSWTPSFLSDWVRSSLLVWAWQRQQELSSAGIGRDAVQTVTARAKRSRLAYEYILPELISEEEAEYEGVLFSVLSREADQDSPEASSNFWSLYTSLDDDKRRDVIERPNLNPGSDLSSLDSDGIYFNESFSGTLCFFVASDFTDCTFENIVLTDCDFTDSIFTNCDFKNVSFKFCDGTIIFDNCRFTETELVDGRSNLPIYEFLDCDFGEEVLIRQEEAVNPEEYSPIAEFDGCTSRNEIESLFEGDWTGLEIHELDGISVEQESEKPPSERCLRALLKRFFPRRAGSGRQRQARGYIRSSALGRGIWPDGAPTGENLISILLSEDFTKGGRQGHIYAPWSSVGGGGEEAMEMRTQYLSFLMDGDYSPPVNRLLQKINDSANW